MLILIVGDKQEIEIRTFVSNFGRVPITPNQKMLSIIKMKGKMNK